MDHSIHIPSVFFIWKILTVDALASLRQTASSSVAMADARTLKLRKIPWELPILRKKKLRENLKI